jgi:hypothetical protein
MNPSQIRFKHFQSPAIIPNLNNNNFSFPPPPLPSSFPPPPLPSSSFSFPPLPPSSSSSFSSPSSSVSFPPNVSAPKLQNRVYFSARFGSDSDSSTHYNASPFPSSSSVSQQIPSKLGNYNNNQSFHDIGVYLFY